MKRVLILSLVLAVVLVLAGCCERTAADGTKTTSATNCFTTAQDKVCNAPASVIEVADAVINLLKPMAATLVPGSAPFVALVTAQGIKDTGCAALSSLNTLVAFIQTMNQAKAMTKGISTTPIQVWMTSSRAISVDPLLQWEGRK